MQTKICLKEKTTNKYMQVRIIPSDRPACEKQSITQRGMSMMLPHGGLPEIISPHLCDLIQKTGGKDGPIGRQFIANPELEKKYYKKKSMDPLVEDEHECAPGLVYKYHGKIDKNGEVIQYGRALWTVTRFCASFCRFCTRGREVGLPVSMKSTTSGAISQKPFLTDEDIKEVLDFLRQHKEINEVILSGGDPLTAPQPYLTKIIEGLAELQKEGAIDIVRIGTRLPIHYPQMIKDWHYELCGKIKNLYLMVHINHPAELTTESLDVLYNFRKQSMAIVSSQTVFLKGVNDSVETLYELFYKITKEGIRPYYMFQNDPVYWANHFTIPIKRAIKIWEQLRPRLSGIAATARFVIDTPYGFGKIPLPEGAAWNVDYSCFYDFKKDKHLLK